MANDLSAAGAFVLMFFVIVLALCLWCGTPERICLTNGGGPACLEMEERTDGE